MATSVAQLAAPQFTERVVASSELIAALTAPKLRKLQAAIVQAWLDGTPLTIRIIPVEGRATKVTVAVEEVL